MKEEMKKDDSKKKDQKDAKEQAVDPVAEMESKLPPEVAEKLKGMKEKLEKFQKAIVEKFDKYIMGIALLPPPQHGMGQMPPSQNGQAAEINKDLIHLLVLIDDADSQKMTKEELSEKLSKIIETTAKDIDKNLSVQTVLLSEVWQSCYDAKYDLLQLIAMSAPVFDHGMLSAIKIAEIHKSMVLKKFEKYIVSYVLAGSLPQGRATKDSDIDVFIVIDDTDVKKMTRAELKDKLRAIIIGMGLEAGEMTGIRNKLNIQVYILTDFWDSIREANPVIFTFLRDGIPFYDRGIFMPWKQLLKMGRIKPSAEAIDMYMSTGEQVIKRIKFKLQDIGMEDLFYALLTPSQAAIMLYGLPPSTPKETPGLMREIFVEKEKMFDDKNVQVLERVIKIRKDLEHGTRKEISGKEIDELLKDTEVYLESLKQLFSSIEKRKEEESVLHMYESTLTLVRDVLRLEGIERAKDTEIAKLFEEELVHLGKVPDKFLRILKMIMQAKKDYDAKKLSKPDIENLKKEYGQFIKFLIEHVQRKRGRELDRARLKVKYGDKHGEVILLGTVAYIIKDLDAEEKEVYKAAILPTGALGTSEKASLEEMESALAKIELPPKVFIKEKIFENLKMHFGIDMEVLVNY